MEDGRDLTSGVARARRLIRAARVASLATTTASDVHAALVTPACTGDLSIVLLLSDLSRHTRHLRDNGTCALLCAAPLPPGLVNPQTIARVGLSCTARPDDDPALRARYLALHPYAAPYAGFGDFCIWRLAIERAHFVGGFAEAATFDSAALRPDVAVADAVAKAEAETIAHCNAGHGGTMAAIGRAFGGVDGDWRLVAVDADGADLLCATAAVRVDWPIAVRERADLRRAIAELSGIANENGRNPAGGAGMAAGRPLT